MDLMSTAQLLGNFGEFFGALLLVGSLAYVGVQVRQNTAVSRAQIYQARADAMQEMFTFLAGFVGYGRNLQDCSGRRLL